MNVTAKPNPTERRASAPPQGAPAARFVLVAQGLVILAFAVGLSVEAGLPPLSAAIAVAAIVVIVVAISKLLSGTQAAPVRRQTAKRALKLATAPVVSQPSLGQTGETGVAIVAGAEDNQSWSSDFDFAVLDTSRPQLNTPRAELSPLEAAVAALPATAPVPNAVPPPLPSHAEPAPTRLPPAAPLRHDGRADRATNVAQNPAPASQAPSSMAADYWSFRPSQPRFEAPATPVPPVAAAAATVPIIPVATTDAALRETDVEAIQSLIKRLADEVNLADQQRLEAPTASDAQNSHVRAASFEPERAVAQSVDALRVTAETMRQPSHMVFGHELPPPIPAPPSRASILAASITAGRADVLLEPILGLDSQEALHFEVSIRLRAEDGSVLPVDARDSELRGTGLLPLFDAAKMMRTSTVARRLSERGKTGAVFSSYSGESLTDLTFRNDAAAASRDRLPGAGHLVLTFTQSDARSFQAPEWASIAHMRMLGFRFALSDVTDLDMDIEGLVGAGFDFVKLDADVFLVGLPSPDSVIPSADVCRYLAGMGLSLVVERIDDEDKFARVYGFGALLGQGQLFGGARILKADTPKSGQAAA